MSHPAVALLETALRARKLDGTLTTALPSPAERTASCVATDVAVLDACLHGGLPRGHVSEIAGPRSSGRTTLLLQLIAAATQRGEIAALVDTLDRFDVASATAAGIDLSRLLWIRGQEVSRLSAGLPGTSGPTPDDAPRRFEPGPEVRGPRPVASLDRALDRALKSLNLVLQAGGFGVVAIDLADVPASALKQLPFTTWMRLQRIVEGSETACVLLVPEPLSRSAGGLTLSLTGRATWTSAPPAEAGGSRPVAIDRSRRLTGLDIRTTVQSPRRRLGGDVQVTTVAR